MIPRLAQWRHLELMLNLDPREKRRVMIGVGALLFCLLWGLIFGLWQFFHSYLMAYLFWLGVSLGCLAVLMLHHLVGGSWGAMIQRILEAGTRTLPLLAVLFIPILLGMGFLYEWALPSVVAQDPILQAKRWYLNIPFFLIRAILFFAVWLVISHYLNHWSQRHEETAGQPIQASYRYRIQTLSAGGILAYSLTMSFASFDWVMSLDAHWYSTMYGLLCITSQALSAFAFAIIVVSRLADVPPLQNVLTTQRTHDLGNMLFAFIMLWAYLAFSQFLIIWSGNTAEEIPWYLHRSQGGWQWIVMLLFLVHFALPFVLLLMRMMKRSLRALTFVATVLFIAHVLDQFWLVLPELHPSRLTIHVMDILAPIGMGCVWVTLYVKLLHQRSLIPLEDRRLQEVSDHE
jgi:hypothetical protein